MRCTTDILRAAAAALRSSAGWLPSIGAWGAWLCVESLVKAGMAQLALAAPFVVATAYYFGFVKVYGMSLLSMSVARGAPSFRYAFSGFGHGWRTVGVHLWIVWRLLLPALPLFAFVVLVGMVVGGTALDARNGWSTVGTAELSALGASGMILAIPAIWAWYRYRLAYYVFVDHVDWKPSAVVDEAARLVRGHRGALFRLDIGFALVCLLLCIPGIHRMVSGLVEFFQSGGDLLGFGEALAESTAGNRRPGIAVFLQGVQWFGFAQLVVLILVQPFWTTALAVCYERARDEDEAKSPPEDGDAGTVPEQT